MENTDIAKMENTDIAEMENVDIEKFENTDILTRFAALPLKERLAEAKKVQRKYPKGIPVVVQPAKRCRFLRMKDMKLVANGDTTVAQLYSNIRNRLTLQPEEAIFFIIGNTIPSLSANMASVYEEFKSEEDNFLYVTIQEENVYGA